MSNAAHPLRFRSQTRRLAVWAMALACAAGCRDKSPLTAPLEPGEPAVPPIGERMGALVKIGDLPIPTGKPGLAFAVAQDGTEYAVGGSDGSVMLIPRSGKESHRLLVGHREEVLVAEYGPDGQTLLTCGSDNRLLVWSLREGKPTQDIKAHNGDVKALAISKDGTLAATGSVADDVRVWRIADGKRLAEFTGHTSTVYAVAWSSDGKRVFSGARDAQMRRWSLEKGKDDARPLAFRNTIVTLRWDPDHKMLWAMGLSGELSAVDPESFAILHTRRVSRGRVLDMDVSSDGTIAIAHKNGQISFWSSDKAREEPLFPPIEAHEGEVRRIRFLPETAGLLSLGDDGTIGLWDPATGQAIGPRKKLPPINGRVRALAANPVGSEIAAVSDGSLFFFTGPKAPVYRPELGTGGVSTVAFSSDGKQVYVGRNNGNLLTAPLPLSDGSNWTRDEIHKGTVRHIVPAPDGKLIYTAGDDITVQLLDSKTRETTRTITDHTSPIVAMAIDPTGKRLATAEENRITFVRYVDSNNIQWTRRGHRITHMAFDPAGARLAMVEERRIVVLYDLEEDGGGRELKKMTGNPATLNGIAWHPDGEALATIDDHGTVRLWNVATGGMLSSADAGRGRPSGVVFGDSGRRIISGGMDPHGSVKAFQLGAPPLVP